MKASCICESRNNSLISMGEIGVNVVHEIFLLKWDVHEVAEPIGQFGSTAVGPLKDIVSLTELGTYGKCH
jgi:hypothetical protein